MPNNKVLHNAKWIIGCKIAQSLIQFVVGMLSARYLGPANYGLINYAAAIVAFAVPLMQLGLRSTLVQEYVNNPEKEGEILGTGLVMNLVSAGACMIGVAAFTALANPGETTTIIVCVLYSASLLAQSVEMIQYWFQAKLLSKYSSLAMLVSYLVVAAYKIWLLVSEKSVYWFALSHTVEYGVTGLLLLIAYRRTGIYRFRFSRHVGKAMLSKSKHYIVAALMVTVFNSTSGVLLKAMIGEAENGFYAAALTCTSITGFVYNAIIDTARPVVLESKISSQESFEKNISRTYSLLTFLSLAQAAVFTVFAKLIVLILFGENYLPAVPVLQIVVWQIGFSSMGSVRNMWILGEEKHSMLWIINLCGAVFNVVANLLLIPLWGACGAALASVATQIFTNVIMGFVLKPIRPNNQLLLRGMNPKFAMELIKTFLAR